MSEFHPLYICPKRPSGKFCQRMSEEMAVLPGGAADMPEGKGRHVGALYNASEGMHHGKS